LTFSKSGLDQGLYYKFAVAAVNAIGTSDKAESVPIIAATIPGVPQTPSLLYQSKTAIGIQWSDPLDLGGTTLDEYIIEMDNGSTAGNTEFTELATISNQETDQYTTTVTLVVGDIYNFRITAVNIVGPSEPSSSFSAMAAVKPDSPGTPTRKTASETSITIEWTAPSDNGGVSIDNYSVYWDEGSGGSFVYLG
jgi:hypothetical protein